MTTAMSSKTGVWLIGAKGGVATTLICGALAIRKGLAPAFGMVTESELCSHLELPGLDALVFGGHDIRSSTVLENAEQIRNETRTIRYEMLAAIRDELVDLEGHIRPGILFESGPAIEALADSIDRCRVADAEEAVTRVQHDLEAFRADQGLERVVVVNLASTEPLLEKNSAHETGAALEKLVAKSDPHTLRASTLYAVAAARAGCPYLNFTPSPGALLPGIADLLERARLPFMGSDGKTGETLIKSVLAPLFRQRNLRVHTWQGYNLLGDRDGQVLSDETHKSAKIASKDTLIHEHLGYPLHTHVAIDYVPSLNDWKTAWDFIHFEGFLGVKMALQFIWQGCDAILAAPLILDMVRFLSLAHRRGDLGPQTHLASFFKSPYRVDIHDFPSQFQLLVDYVEGCRE